MSESNVYRRQILTSKVPALKGLTSDVDDPWILTEQSVTDNRGLCILSNIYMVNIKCLSMIDK